MNFDQSRNVQTLPFEGPVFSVCSLVTRDDQYDRMLKSFAAHGLTTDNSEFIFVDNRSANAHDAYGGLNAMVAKERGRYIICCHQDVELIGDGAGGAFGDGRWRNLRPAIPGYGLSQAMPASGPQVVPLASPIPMATISMSATCWRSSTAWTRICLCCAAEHL